MLVVWSSAEQLRPLLSGWSEQLDIAAFNAPGQTVVAGATEALEQLQGVLWGQRIRSQRLQTSHAFHSPLVEPLLDAFGEVAQQVRYASPQVPYYSSLRGGRVEQEVADARYWQEHLRHSVRFHEAAGALLAQQPTAVLEVGAGRTLVGLLRHSFGRAAPALLGGLSGTAQEPAEQQRQLAQLYLLGASLAWGSICGSGGRKLPLPTYPFEPQRYWFATAGSSVALSGLSCGVLAAPAVHPLLGVRLPLAGREIVYETQLSGASYLQEHRIGGRRLLPAAGYLELALAAGQDAGFKLCDVCQLKIRRPLSLEGSSASAPLRLQVVLAPAAGGFECRLLSWQQDRWQLHASCQLTPEGSPPLALPDVSAGGAWHDWSVAEHYAACRRHGLDYGPAFQGLCRVRRGEHRAWGEVRLPAQLSAAGYHVHPALLDACLQVTAAALPASQQHAWVPVYVERYRAYGAVEHQSDLHVHVTLRSTDHPAGDVVSAQPSLTADVLATSDTGQPAFWIEGLTLQRSQLSDVDQLAYREHWTPQLRLRESAPVVPDLSVDDIAVTVEGRRDDIAARTGLLPHMALLDKLESLCGEYVFWFLQDNFQPLHPGLTFTSQQAVSALGVHEDHRRLLHRMLCILEDAGYLLREGDSWKVRRRPEGERPDVASHRLLTSHPAALPELTLLARCCQHLLPVLRGELDPLRLLFPTDGSVSAGSLYRDSVGGRAMNQLVAEAVGQVADKLPAGRGLRILEVGAGTGSTTQSVLQRIPESRVRYTFTDIATSFLPTAKTQFATYRNMQFRVLDVERDPCLQGWEPASFDVVIAANVIHAHGDVSESLNHIRQLLAAGGKLILLEGTCPTAWLDLTFGLTKGWWRFCEHTSTPELPAFDSRTVAQCWQKQGSSQHGSFCRGELRLTSARDNTP